MTILGLYIPSYLVVIVGLYIALMAVVAVWEETRKWK